MKLILYFIVGYVIYSLFKMIKRSFNFNQNSNSNRSTSGRKSSNSNGSKIKKDDIIEADFTEIKNEKEKE